MNLLGTLSNALTEKKTFFRYWIPPMRTCALDAVEQRPGRVSGRRGA